MTAKPKVSVIIPSYNYADFIARCVQSVLDQTFTNFEVIVVDDGSKDHTKEVIEAFTDPRVRYIYQDNKGLPGARNTGIRAAKGEYLAYLDSDDTYHPRKLEIQVAFLDVNPDVGLAYNSRFLVDSNGRLLRLRRAPATVTLTDLVAGYPFAPSDVVMRRTWAEKIGLFDESFVLNSEDLNFHIRLMMAGCQFAGVPHALAYRQIHTGRAFRNIAGKIETYQRALDTAFDDPACPADVLTLRDEAYAEHHLVWGYQAIIQGEVALGQKLLDQALVLKPDYLADNGRFLQKFLVHISIRDGGDPVVPLRKFFGNLPASMAILAPLAQTLMDKAILHCGLRDIIWNESRQADAYLHYISPALAQTLIDDDLIALLNDQMNQYEIEFGEDRGEQTLQRIVLALKQLGAHAQLRQIGGHYALNRAFRSYRKGAYGAVLVQIMRAIRYEPHHLFNRGTISVMVRSLVHA